MACSRAPRFELWVAEWALSSMSADNGSNGGEGGGRCISNSSNPALWPFSFQGATFSLFPFQWDTFWKPIGLLYLWIGESTSLVTLSIPTSLLFMSSFVKV